MLLQTTGIQIHVLQGPALQPQGPTKDSDFRSRSYYYVGSGPMFSTDAVSDYGSLSVCYRGPALQPPGLREDADFRSLVFICVGSGPFISTDAVADYRGAASCLRGKAASDCRSRSDHLCGVRPHHQH